MQVLKSSAACSADSAGVAGAVVFTNTAALSRLSPHRDAGAFGVAE